MRKLLIVCLFILFGGVGVSTLHAQKKDSKGKIIDSSVMLDKDNAQQGTDSLRYLMPADTVVIVHDSLKWREKVEVFKPNPNKAVMYAAIFPGLGQIYNKKYWKLPIIYGGFVGITYAVTWNGRMYNDYSRAYKDIMSGEGDSWKNIVNVANPSEADIERWKPQFKRKKDYFRRNRDLAIICGVGLYALTLLDAYVDAQLYNFDVSPDLSMRVEPIMYAPTLHTPRTIGIQCSVSF